MPSVLSLFSGSGGLDLGFEAAGFNILGCLELEPWAVESLAHNHPQRRIVGPPTLSGDIRDYDASSLCGEVGVTPDEVDLIIGGPPCQPFSQAAAQRFLATDKRFKRQGFADTVKGTLIFDYLRIVSEIKPRNFVLENVSGILKLDHGHTLKHIISILANDLGYVVCPVGVTHMEEYGVPQYRERIILWGSRTLDDCTLPVPTHAKEPQLFLEPFRTSAQALVGINKGLPNHQPRRHFKESVERYKRLRYGEREKLGRVDRLDPSKPSKTVIAGGMHGGGRSHLHPFEARTLTVRECARLQTYPDWYEFKGTTARQFTQAGNSVPPLYALQLATHILESEYGEAIDLEEAAKLLCPYLYTSLRQDILSEQLLDYSRSYSKKLLYHSLEANGKIASYSNAKVAA